MLVYGSDTDADQVAARFFSQHGRPMPAIDAAFLKYEGVNKLKIADILRAHRESQQKELAQDAAYQIVVRFTAADSAEEAKVAEKQVNAARISEELAEKEQELQREQKTPIVSAEQVEQMRIEIAQLKQQKQAADAEPVSVSKRLGPHEHAPLLRRAISEAKEHLVIISPWINDGVMATHQRGLEDLLARKAELFIGFGMTEHAEDDPKSKNGQHTLDFFHRMRQRFPKQLHLVRLGDTHAKVLIKDRDFVVAGSFNWMSFRGTDRGNRFREEQSILTTERSLIEETFAYYLKRFAEFDTQLVARLPSPGPR